MNIRNFSGKKIILSLVVVLVLSLAAFGTKIWANSKASPPPVPKTYSQNLNKEFDLPIDDNNTTIQYTIVSAQVQDQIIVNGQSARAIPGRTFLILSLKLVNPSTTGLNINTRDYVRLTVNNSSDMLAPEVYNDPVEVQAISTKYTRLGFPINTNDKNLKLLVGPINSAKTTLPLSFGK